MQIIYSILEQIEYTLEENVFLYTTDSNCRGGNGDGLSLSQDTGKLILETHGFIKLIFGFAVPSA